MPGGIASGRLIARRYTVAASDCGRATTLSTDVMTAQRYTPRASESTTGRWADRQREDQSGGLMGIMLKDADPSVAHQPAWRPDHDRSPHGAGAREATPEPDRPDRADVRRHETARRRTRLAAGARRAARHRPHHGGGADRRPGEKGRRRAAPQPGRPPFLRPAPDRQGPHHPETGDEGLRRLGGRVLRPPDRRRAEGAGRHAHAGDPDGTSKAGLELQSSSRGIIPLTE